MSSLTAAAPPRRLVDVRSQLRMVLMREASPTARSLEHPRRGFLAGAAPPAGRNSCAGAPSAETECVAADAMRSSARRRYAARVVSYSQCQTAQSSSFPPRVAAPGFFLIALASP